MQEVTLLSDEIDEQVSEFVIGIAKSGIDVRLFPANPNQFRQPFRAIPHESHLTANP